jgi:hypothetical protein
MLNTNSFKNILVGDTVAYNAAFTKSIKDAPIRKGLRAYRGKVLEVREGRAFIDWKLDQPIWVPLDVLALFWRPSFGRG